jgi:hypothetical protein
MARSNRLRMRMRVAPGNRPPARTTATRCRGTTTRSRSSLPITTRAQGRKASRAEISPPPPGKAATARSSLPDRAAAAIRVASLPTRRLLKKSPAEGCCPLFRPASPLHQRSGGRLVAQRPEDSHGSHTATAWLGRQEQMFGRQKQNPHRRQAACTPGGTSSTTRVKGSVQSWGIAQGALHGHGGCAPLGQVMSEYTAGASAWWAPLIVQRRLLPSWLGAHFTSP